MYPSDRRKLNQKIKALQHRLCIDDDNFRQIVLDVEPRSEGHLTHCGDEEANLIMIPLRRVADRLPATSSPRHAPCTMHSAQNRMIARLMDYLGWRWSNTASLCKRMTGKPRTDKCTAHELSLIIRAMVSIIDGDLKTGKLKLSDEDLQDYLGHTKKFRKKQDLDALCSMRSAPCASLTQNSGA
jgi:hypothetical protein